MGVAVMRRRKSAPDPRAKRRHETDLQWRVRLARMDQLNWDKTETLITPETAQHGDYHDDTVMHVETGTRAETKRNRMQRPLEIMFDQGKITKEQLVAAHEITWIYEAIELVKVRSANLEARIDNSGADRDALVEGLGRIRLERVYTKWRVTLPMPKRLILDMLLSNGPLVATARVYNIPWRKARGWLIDSLDRWHDIKRREWKNVDEGDVNSIYAKLGCGRLSVPLDG